MNSSGRKPKSNKGKVSTISLRGKLFLRWTYEGQRYHLYLSVPDTTANRDVVQLTANKIEYDVRHGRFDRSLSSYKSEACLSTATPDAPPKLKLKEIWARYVDYRAPNVSPKTIENTYKPVTMHLEKCKTDGIDDVLVFRKELFKATTRQQARRTLMQLSACCKWSLQHGLIEGNPFDGMYNELSKDKPAPPMAFTVEERDAIIAAFETHNAPGISYSYYAPFVKFLFWTGCRPSEAIGLKWGSITSDCSRVHFHESMVAVNGAMVHRKETKTGGKRWFTCPARLQELLQSLSRGGKDELVFPSPTGKAINSGNFSQRAWRTVLTGLDLTHKDGVKLTPYNCRDTFITLQALNGNSSTTIARWCGNSAAVIEAKYLDKLKLDYLKPTDV